jgi:hypothetical protein
MNGPAVPMTQEQITRNRRIIVLVAAVFVASSVGVLLWAMNVVGSQRDRARGTDAALRSVAWAVLSYAAANDGAFPTSDLALAGAGADAGAAPPAGKPWPSSRESAMAGLPPVPVDEALGTVGVTWGASPDVVPNLNTKGNPVSYGTVDAVNGWLAEYARDRMSAGGKDSK